jgi:hypothetical protein
MRSRERPRTGFYSRRVMAGRLEKSVSTHGSVPREDGVVLVTDQVPSVTAFAPDGARIDRAGPSLNGAHGIALGRTGEIYLAEIEPSSVTKLIPA